MTALPPLRLGYAGTPEFAVPALATLIESTASVVAVLTQPDRPSGRGRKLTASPVKQTALAASIPVLQPSSLRDPATQQAIDALDLDLLVVAAYGLILPMAVLESPRLGCWNIHASLLPRWRGAAPIHRAILAGDEQAGVCIMQMDAGLDTGAVLARKSEVIDAKDTTGSLHDRLARLGAELLVNTIQRRRDLVPEPQPETGVTYAEKLSKTEAKLDWQRSALELERQIRAFDPWPVATAKIQGYSLRIWAADVVAGSAPVGFVRRADAAGIEIGTGAGILRITELQKPGSRRVSVAEFLNANAIELGDVCSGQH